MLGGKQKKCTKCKMTKDHSMYYSNCRSKDWLSYWCKKCRSKSQKNAQYYKKSYRRRLVCIYREMKQRCTNVKNSSYKNYWWRWILCKRETKEDFIRDMMDSYKKHYDKNKSEKLKRNTTLDRIDNNWHYCKENCRWVTYVEQQNNRRNNLRFFWMTLKKICSINWLSKAWTLWRINKWLSKQQVLSKKKRLHLSKKKKFA